MVSYDTELSYFKKNGLSNINNRGVFNIKLIKETDKIN